jgi:hypothetical protein
LVLTPTCPPTRWWLTGLAVILLTSGAWAQCFQNTVNYPVSNAPIDLNNGPLSVAVGDFNGDSKPDLAVIVANSPNNNVSVLLGTGSGGFGAATSFALGAGPVSVAVGDFNGDGKPDLAVVNSNSNTVSVLLGTGSGGFGPRTDFAVGGFPLAVAVGDFNGDGKPDLAVANAGSNSVSVLLGNGSGGFGAATNFAVAAGPRSVAVGDFNGDGKPDLAVVTALGNNVSVLLGTGSGSFGAATNFAVGTQPYSVAVGDFNGDGKPDLATANAGGNNVSVLLGNGSGGFGAATSFAVAAGPRSVAVGDFNGDGKPDLATASGDNSVSVLLGNGSGGFGVATSFAVGTSPQSVAVGDFNGDGKPDLATANHYSNNVSVLYNCTNFPISLTTSASPTSVCAGSTVALSVTASGGTTGMPDHPYSYTWVAPAGATLSATSTSAVSATVTTSGVNTFTVTVADVGGSPVSTTVSVAVDPPVEATLSPSGGTITCAQTSVTLTAGGGGTYRFSNGAIPIGSTNQATVNTAGTYSVTVTAASGCTAVAAVTVSQDNTQPVATLSASPSTTLTCSQTQVALFAGGGDRYVFAGPGIVSQEGSQALVNTAGVYSVTVTNSSTGCFSVTAITISQEAAPQASLTASPSATLSCAVRSVTLTAGGSNTGETLSYAFGGPGVVSQSGNQAVVNTAGVYSVTVTNTASGCSSTTTITIDQNTSGPETSLAGSGPLTCTVRSVTLTASPAGQTYQFSAGATQLGTSNQAVVSSPGLYSVTVVSGNGCTGVASLSVSQDNTKPVATLSASPSTTLTCSQTQLTLSAGGGNSYAFSGPGIVSQEGSQALVNTAGVYSVTVTNNDTGCFSVTAITISQDNTVPQASLTSSGLITCATSSVTLTASPNGLSYAFAGPGVVSQNGNQAIVNASGTYSVTVSNGANGCSALAQTTVTSDQTAPFVSITANPSLTITQGQSATLTASGASAYAWNNGANTPAIVVSTAGPYSVTGTAANGCTGTASVTLMVNLVVTAPFAITAVTTVDCTPVLPNRFSVSFTPRYSGLDGSPLSFSVTNELFPTTQPGPYTLQLYTDNPVITLEARQGGATTKYTYDWLAACNSATTPNTPPRVVMGIPGQTATVGQYFAYVIPDGTFTDTETPGSLRLSASGLPGGLSFSGATLSGTPSSTVGSPVSITITATDPGNLSASTVLVLTVQPATGTPPPTAPFAITGVTTISCTPVANRINISFTPRYAGLNGQPIAFEVINELSSTTEPGPYSLTLYRDNPVITLRATQTGSAGPVSYAYNWLSACQSVGQDNTPPRLNQPVASQTAVVGQGYSLNLTNTFIDQETPDQISLSAAGLPAGLSVNGKFISGTPSMSGVSSVTLTATDGGGLSTSTVFSFTVLPASPQPPTNPPTATFSITGVTTVSCEVISTGERRVTFTPRYAGLDGSPVSFRVVNETLPTINPGPYSLNLYTDNPVITLEATQSGVVSPFSYGWLAACNPGARLGAGSEVPLSVTVLGNPVMGESVQVEVRGAEGQAFTLSVTDARGHQVSEQSVGRAGVVERHRLRLGQTPAGVLLLRVSTSTQSQTVKLIKAE